MYHRGTGLRRPELLGEVQVALETFELMNETRMWKNIEPKIQDEVIFCLICVLSLKYHIRRVTIDCTAF